MATWTIPSCVTGELLQRFIANLEGAAAENYGNKALDGTIVVSDTTDSKGQNVLRVVVSGRIPKRSPRPLGHCAHRRIGRI